MGPLPFGSGRFKSWRAASAPVISLRWGRSLSEAEGRAINQHSRTVVILASMGPLPFGSGRFATRRRSPRRKWLQWGRSLSEAEGSTLARRREGKAALQWGRSLSEAEGSSNSASFASPAKASMGPLPFGSGRALPYLLQLLHETLLQWGRSLSEAEGLGAEQQDHRDRQPASMGPLPFGSGRVDEVLEVVAPHEASMGPLPFGSGRARRGVLPDDLPVRASMGPLPFGSGRFAAVARFYGFSHNASMGPLPFGSGRAGRQNASASASGGFNGAAPFRKRKGVDSFSTNVGGAEWLQWGRSLSEAEGAPDQRSRSNHGDRFNGAAPFRKRKEGTVEKLKNAGVLLQWGRSLSEAEGS